MIERKCPRCPRFRHKNYKVTWSFGIYRELGKKSEISGTSGTLLLLQYLIQSIVYIFWVNYYRITFVLHFFV